MTGWLIHRRKKLPKSDTVHKETESFEPTAHEADSYPVADTKTSHHFKSELENKPVAAAGYGRSELEGSLRPDSSIAPSSLPPVSPMTGQSNRWSAVSCMHGEGRWLGSMNEGASCRLQPADVGCAELEGSQQVEHGQV